MVFMSITTMIDGGSNHEMAINFRRKLQLVVNVTL